MVESKPIPQDRNDVKQYLGEPGTLTRRGFLVGMAKDPLVQSGVILTPIGAMTIDAGLQQEDTATTLTGIVETSIGTVTLLQRGIVWWRSRGGRLDNKKKSESDGTQLPTNIFPPTGA